MKHFVKKKNETRLLYYLCAVFIPQLLLNYFFIVKDQFCISKFFFVFKGKKGVTVTLTLVD